jgi:hypothetical protein
MMGACDTAVLEESAVPRSSASLVVHAAPDAVWGFLRDFDATPHYVPPITASEILDGKRADQVGCERVLTLDGGGLVRETLVALSDLDRTLTYHLTEGPFPFTGYYSTIRVIPVEDGAASFVEWSAVYDCESADVDGNEELLADGLFRPGLEAVRDRFS